ncbi:hypothetical protein AAHC03_05698 [Spirometra sp. Aus1]
MASLDFAAFRRQHETDFKLEELDAHVREEAFSECKTYLANRNHEKLADCLACLRVLSRDRTLQSKLAEPDILTHLIREAGLDSTQTVDSTVYDSECAVESLKCLSNVVFQNPLVISTLKSHGCLDSLVSRCEKNSKELFNAEILLFDLKLLFLLSALDRQARLELLTNNFASDNFPDILRRITDMDFLKSQLAFDCAQEMLKFLFNLGYARKELGHSEVTYETTYRSLTPVVRDLLVKQTSSPTMRFGLINHCVNLLTTVPVTCYALLLFDPADPISDSPPPHKDENVCRALASLLDFLDHQLSQADTMASSSGGSSELLTPILNVLASASRANSVIRKYCRLKILPYLGDEVRHLPQEGTTLRNKLSKRLTATGASDGVAESTALLIFILCKEKVSRAIKYSGFGNFAGFLARHGLMGGSQPPSDPYSSSSSDSETEAYQQLRDNVNPVTGRFEPYKPSPMEGMSQEQKEYEAMKLVEKIDKLQRSGIIQPGTVGEDGRVHPVEHVLQLIQDVKVDSTKEDSDSD